MGLANLFDRLLHAPGQKLCWKELTGEHAGDDRPFEFKTNEAYFTIRLREMYVCKARVLWRKLYPMVYSLITQGSEEQTAVVGPGQLKVFSETNLDRMVNLNHRLAGPTVYR